MICAPSWVLLFYGTLENQLNFPITLSHEQRESSDFFTIGKNIFKTLINLVFIQKRCFCVCFFGFVLFLFLIFVVVVFLLLSFSCKDLFSSTDAVKGQCKNPGLHVCLFKSNGVC